MKDTKNNNPNSILRLDGMPVATMTTVQLAGEIDKRVRRVFKLCESESAEVRAAASDAIKTYVDGQIEMFKSRGLKPNRALKEAIVPTGDRLASGMEIMRIVPRGETLEELPNDETASGHGASIAQSRGYAAGMGYAREARRGKYNDAGLIIEQSAASVDASEVVPFVAM